MENKSSISISGSGKGNLSSKKDNSKNNRVTQ